MICNCRRFLHHLGEKSYTTLLACMLWSMIQFYSRRPKTLVFAIWNEFSYALAIHFYCSYTGHPRHFHSWCFWTASKDFLLSFCLSILPTCCNDCVTRVFNWSLSKKKEYINMAYKCSQLLETRTISKKETKIFRLKTRRSSY